MRCRIGLLACVVALASCGGVSRPARPGTLSARRRPAAADSRIPSCAELDPGRADERVCAIAEVDSSTGAVDVFLRIEPGALPVERTEVIVRLPTGQPHPLGPMPEPTEIRYRVVLGASEAVDRGSFQRLGGWHVTGRSILPSVEVDGAVVDAAATLLLEGVDAPLFTSAGTEQRVFDGSLERLADESFEFGALVLTRREVEGTTLWVGSTAWTDGAVEAAADAFSRAYRDLFEQLGAPWTDSILIAHHRSDTAFGQRVGSSVVWAMPEDPDLTVSIASGGLGPLTQLWVPGAHEIEEAWLRRGLPRFYAMRVGHALVSLPDDAFARAILRDFRLYQGGAPERSLREPPADDAEWVVRAGTLASFCLDAHLSANRGSLSATLRRSLSRTDAISTESLLEDLAAVSPSAASYLAALVETRGAFAIEGCFEPSWQAREVTFEGWSERTNAEAIGALELRPVPGLGAMRVQEAREEGTLAGGDVLLRVGGHPIADGVDLAWALRDAEPGDPIVLLVRRRGDVRRLEHIIDQLTDERRTEQAYVELLPVDTAR